MLVDNTVKIKSGSTDIVKVYSGSNVVYETTPPYTPLQYVGSTGDQQIDLGYIPNADTTFEITFKIMMRQNERNIFACKWDMDGFVLMDYGSGLRWHNNSSNFYEMDYNLSYMYPKTFTIYRNTIKVDGTTILDKPYTTINYTNTIKVFAFNNRHLSYYNLYGIKISENGVLLHNFIPVLDENNTPCLYDTIDKVYKYNSSSLPLVYG